MAWWEVLLSILIPGSSAFFESEYDIVGTEPEPEPEPEPETEPEPEIEIVVVVEDTPAIMCDPAQEDSPDHEHEHEWIWEDPEELPEDTPSPGSSWYHPSALEDCCNPETKTFAEYLNLVVVVSTDKIATTNALQAINPNTPQQTRTMLRGWFINLLSNPFPGVLVKKYNLNGFNRTIPTTAIRKRVTKYQFEQKFNFTIPTNVRHLTAFTYLGLDIEAINNDYGTNLPLLVTIQSPINIINVYHNGQPNEEPGTAIVTVAEPDPRLPPGPFSVTGPLPGSPTRAFPGAGAGPIIHPGPGIPPRGPGTIISSVRFSSIEKCLIKNSTVGVAQHLALNQQKSTSRDSSIPANRFWVTRNDQKSNTTFFAFDRRTLLRNNSLIKNLRDSAIYDGGRIEEVTIEKIDISNPKMNKLLVATSENNNRVFISKTQTKDFDGSRQSVASITQLPLNKDVVRFIKFDDFTPSPDKFKYLVTFTFQDPSVKYLKSSVALLQRYISSCIEYYDYISSQRSLSKDKNVTINRKYIKSITPKIARLIDLYVELLTNFGGKPCTSKRYLISLANPTARAGNHDMFIKITSSLLETLLKVSDSLSINNESLGKTSSNKLSSTQKQRSKITKEFYSKPVRNIKTIGYDFISSKEVKNSNTVEETDANFSNLNLTQATIAQRGENELLKFWDNIPSAVDPNISNLAGTQTGAMGIAQLVENAKFNLTPNIIIGGEKQINLTNIGAYNDLFYKKINAIPSALEGKLEQDSQGYVDNGGMNISVSIVGDNSSELSAPPILRDPNNYFEDNNEFISGDITSYTNEEVVATTREIFQIFGVSAQSEFETNFNSTLTPPDISNDINSILRDRNFQNFPPSYQAYLLRNNSKSKFSTEKERYDNISASKNSSIVNNFMNTVGTIQYLEMGNNIAKAQWRPLNNNILNSQKFLFCRILILQDGELNIGFQEAQIFKQYFTVSNEDMSPQGINAHQGTTVGVASSTQRDLESASSENSERSDPGLTPQFSFIGL